MNNYREIEKAEEKLNRLCVEKDKQLKKEMGDEYENYFTDALDMLVEQINCLTEKLSEQSKYIEELEKEIGD